jgi:hypothetical protein
MKLVHATSPSVMAGAGPYVFVTNVLYVETVMNSGLASLGHLLIVTSNTPAVCRVDSNLLWDRTGGIVNKTQVTALDNGNCQLTFYFPGTTTRAPSTLIWSKTVTGFPIATSTFIEVQYLQKVVGSTGNTLSLKALDAGRIALNAFIKTPDPKLTGSTPSLNSLVNVGTLTPLVCAVEKISNTMGSSNPYTGTVIKPLTAGTCTILIWRQYRCKTRRFELRLERHRQLILTYQMKKPADYSAGFFSVAFAREQSIDSGVRKYHDF